MFLRHLKIELPHRLDRVSGPLGDNVKGFILDKIRRQRRAEILESLRPGREARSLDDPVSVRPKIRVAVSIATDHVLAPLFFQQLPGVAEDRQEILSFFDSLWGLLLSRLQFEIEQIAN